MPYDGRQLMPHAQYPISILLDDPNVDNLNSKVIVSFGNSWYYSFMIDIDTEWNEELFLERVEECRSVHVSRGSIYENENEDCDFNESHYEFIRIPNLRKLPNITDAQDIYVYGLEDDFVMEENIPFLVLYITDSNVKLEKIYTDSNTSTCTITFERCNIKTICKIKESDSVNALNFFDCTFENQLLNHIYVQQLFITDCKGISTLSHDVHVTNELCINSSSIDVVHISGNINAIYLNRMSDLKFFDRITCNLLHLKCTSFIDVEKIKCMGQLFIYTSSITNLPELNRCLHTLHIENSNIAPLPNTLKLCGSLTIIRDLFGVSSVVLPDGLIIGILNSSEYQYSILMTREIKIGMMVINSQIGLNIIDGDRAPSNHPLNKIFTNEDLTKSQFPCALEKGINVDAGYIYLDDYFLMITGTSVDEEEGFTAYTGKCVRKGEIWSSSDHICLVNQDGKYVFGTSLKAMKVMITDKINAEVYIETIEHRLRNNDLITCAMFKELYYALTFGVMNTKIVYMRCIDDDFNKAFKKYGLDMKNGEYSFETFKDFLEKLDAGELIYLERDIRIDKYLEWYYSLIGKDDVDETI